jgi:hypothetical protein
MTSFKAKVLGAKRDIWRLFVLAVALFYSTICFATGKPFTYCEWALAKSSAIAYQDLTERISSNAPLSQNDVSELRKTISKAVQALHFTSKMNAGIQQRPPSAVLLLNYRLERLTTLLGIRILASEAYNLPFAAGLEDISSHFKDLENGEVKQDWNLKFQSLWGEYLARPFNQQLLLENHQAFLTILGDIMEDYLLTGNQEFTATGTRMVNALIKVWNLKLADLKPRMRREHTQLKNSLSEHLWSFTFPSSHYFYLDIAAHSNDIQELYECNALFSYFQEIYQTIMGIKYFPREFSQAENTLDRHSMDKRLQVRFASIIMNEVYAAPKIEEGIKDLFTISEDTAKAIKEWEALASKRKQILFPSSRGFKSVYKPDEFLLAMRYVIGVTRFQNLLGNNKEQSHFTGWLAKISMAMDKTKFNRIISRYE